MKTKAIIPAAGLGTRVGMKPNESKEMLIDPITKKPVIDYALELCTKYNLEPVIITRKAKKDLIKHVENDSHLLIVDEDFIDGKEWPDTVLASQMFWGANNILILPDTRFEPNDIIRELDISLKLGAEISLALHRVGDGSKWCIVRDYMICEKPESKDPAWAWGLVGFKQEAGIELFEGLKVRGQYNNLSRTSFSYLKSFKDITRNKKIEMY